MFFFFLSLCLIPFFPPLRLFLFFPRSLALILVWSCYTRFDPGFKNKTKCKQYFNYYDMNMFPCERWQISLRLSWCHCFLDKGVLPLFGEALRCFVAILNDTLTMDSQQENDFFCSFNNFTKHLCSEIPGVYFAQDWETTAGKANSLPLSEYVTQIICMTV